MQKRINKTISKNKRAFLDGNDLNDNEITSDIPQPVNLSNINLNEDDSIESMFRNEQQNNQNDVKELFHEDKVKARTDISPRQIKLITKAYYLAEITGMPEIKKILNDFLTLSISKDRKSRAEYVQALQSKMAQDLASANANNVRGQFGK
jgi:flagellar biosynthesis GTPase FlhF